MRSPLFVFHFGHLTASFETRREVFLCPHFVSDSERSMLNEGKPDPREVKQQEGKKEKRNENGIILERNKTIL